MKATIPALSDKRQEKCRQRASTFYSQTVAENNARLNNKTTFAELRDEIKFLQSELLCRSG